MFDFLAEYNKEYLAGQSDPGFPWDAPPEFEQRAVKAVQTAMEVEMLASQPSIKIRAPFE